MIPEYYVYVADHGFWGAAGTYTSELKQARRFQHEEALKFCRSRYNANLASPVSAMPIAIEDIERITGK